MNNYFYIKLKIGGYWFYLRQVTWFKFCEPCFEPIFVTNVEMAGLFFMDQVKNILKEYPDATILKKIWNGQKFEFEEVKINNFTR